MKGQNMNIVNSLVVPSVLGLVSAGIVFAALTGRSLPLISNPRAALVALLVVGMLMCTGGIGQVGASGRWASPPAIAGYLLGAALLVVILFGLAGWKLPGIENPRAAVAAVAVLMGVKFSIGTVGFLLHWL